MKKITVAYITPPFAQHQGRGVGVYTRNLIEELKRDHSITIKIATRQTIPRECDIVHFPYFDPFFLTLPFFNQQPTIITIHDVIPLVFPDHFPVGIRGKIKWYIQKEIAAHANAIITDSQTSKTDIIRLMGLPSEKVIPIHLAAHSRFTQIKNEKKLDTIRRKHQLPQRFVLYIGDANWNKNLPRIVAAVKQINATLVLVSQALGENKNNSHPWNVSAQEAMKAIKGDRRFLTRSISDSDELVALYNLASVFVFPSLYEGFGLPVLEAMACGCPVVCSDEGSLKEIIGSAALIVDPYDINSIADGIGEIYFNESAQNIYSLAGFTQAKKFSWKKTAAATLNVYRSVLRIS